MMAALMYLIIYVFMFMAAMKLRKTQPNVKWLCIKAARLVLSGVIFDLRSTDFRLYTAQQLQQHAVFRICGDLVAGLIVAGVPPFTYALRKPSWQMVPKAEADQYSAALQIFQDADDKAANPS